MNIVEALRTMRPLRRPTPRFLGSRGDGWWGHSFVLMLLVGRSDAIIEHHQVAKLTVEDLLADDWEVKPENT